MTDGFHFMTDEIHFMSELTPVYGHDVDIAVDFISQRRLEFTPENERQAIPECLIWRDRIDKWWDDGIRRDNGTRTPSI